MSKDSQGDDQAANAASDELSDSQRREAMKLVGKAALLAVPTSPALLASQPASASAPPSATSPESSLPSHYSPQDAWGNFQKEMSNFREWLLSQPFASSPLVRAQAENLAIQMPSITYMYYGGYHTGYPLIRTDSFFVPLLYTTGFPNPDFIYRHVFLNGAQRYRMWGKLGSARILNDVQVFSAFYGSRDPMISTQNFSVLDYANEDGSFEIILGPDVPAEKGIRLSPEHDACFLAFREVVLDWGNETRMDVYIELLDDIRDPIVFDEAEMTERVYSSARWIGRRRVTLETTWGLALGDGIWHKFKRLAQSQENSNKLGANPMAHYLYLPYDLPEDEALVVEMVPPKCTYWGVQMMDMWMQSLDFSFHQSSLNKTQCAPDEDGVYRLVVAHRDPGVPNWIDTVAPAPGILVYRVYDAKEEVVLPSVKRVALADVRKDLPANTAVVTAAQRKSQLKARARDSLGRYGYFNGETDS